MKNISPRTFNSVNCRFTLAMAMLCLPVTGVCAQEERPVTNDANEVVDARDDIEKKPETVVRPQNDDFLTPDLDYSSASETAPPPVSDSVRLGAILIDGASQLDPSIFASAIEPVIGTEVSREELSRLTQQVAEIARDNGYVFASAYIAPQKLELGILRITLDTGTIDEIRIIGSDNVAIRELLNRLVGKLVTRSLIERQILLANDIPKIRVQKTAFVREEGIRILQVDVRELENDSRLSADNYGSNSFGPVRARLATEIRGLFDDSDIAEFSARTVPTDPKEILSASAAYETSLGTDGLRLGLAASVSDTEPGGFRTGSGIKGNSQYVRGHATHPLIRASDGSLWLTADLAYLSIAQTLDDVQLQRDDQLTLSLGLLSNVKILGGRLRSGVKLKQGIDALGTTRFGDPLASRRDGDGVFTLGEFYTGWTGGIVGNLSLRTTLSGQYASRPLFSSQEMSLGGAYSVRGYDFSERSGDNGIAGLFEVREDFDDAISFLDRLQLYSFVDGGYVHNLRNGFGGGTLFSAGGGLRLRAGIFDFELESAIPLTEDRFDSGDRSPKINVQIGVNF